MSNRSRLGFLEERTRPDPESQRVKAIDPQMSSNIGMHRGFIKQGGKVAEATFRAATKKELVKKGYKPNIIRHAQPARRRAALLRARAAVRGVRALQVHRRPQCVPRVRCAAHADRPAAAGRQ